MTDTIEQKALALLNEVAVERGYNIATPADRRTHYLLEVACRAIEQHEAFRQEVSDALLVYQKADSVAERSLIWDALTRFIIAKPDPLVVVLGSAPYPASSKELAAHIRADMKARGYEWRKIEGEG